MKLLLSLLACSSAPTVPPGNWANIAPASVTDRIDLPEGQLLEVEEGDWHFHVLAPDAPVVAVGDHLLLGTGPEVRPRWQGIDYDALQIDDLAVVSAEVAALASAVPELPEGVRSVESVHIDRYDLAGRTVRGGGRIVKASMDVFDTNWYHLRDGTGSEEEETHDLTFTSDAVFSVGDVVWVEGELTVDHDLGFGYFYPAIFQGPTVSSVDGVQLAAASEPAAVEGEPLRVSSPPRPPAPSPAAAASAGPAPDPLPTYGPAPAAAYEVQGLVLGLDGDGAFDAWMDGADCDRAPALARRTVHATCRGVQDAWAGATRPVDVLAVRAEGDDALHHLSGTRTHALMADGLHDLERTVAGLESRLGAPHEVRLPEPGVEPRRLAAYRATWRFDEVLVEASLMRLQPTRPVMVRERVVLQGVEASLPDRGVGVHGAGIRRAPNPHRASGGDVAFAHE